MRVGERVREIRSLTQLNASLALHTIRFRYYCCHQDTADDAPNGYML